MSLDRENELSKNTICPKQQLQLSHISPIASCLLLMRLALGLGLLPMRLGKLTAVVGQLTVLENFFCCQSSSSFCFVPGLREFYKFCWSSDVNPLCVSVVVLAVFLLLDIFRKFPSFIFRTANSNSALNNSVFFYTEFKLELEK